MLNLTIVVWFECWADNVFSSCQLEMKQRYLVGKMNEEKESILDEFTMETLGED